MRRRSTRAERIVDFSGIVMILVGIASYLWAQGGMQLLERKRFAPGGAPGAAMAEFDMYWFGSRLGLALAVTGVLLLVVASIAATVLARRQRAAASMAAGSSRA